MKKEEKARDHKEVRLRRVLSMPLLTFYGLGTILGAGIYVLVGKVAGAAGMYAPVAFLVAAAVAGFTAFTYAELVARYPQSAAEAVYIQEGLGRRELTILVGLLIVFSGLVSSATIASGFVGYLRVFIDLPDTLVIVLVVLLLGVLAAWGILESVTAAAVATIIEIFGLLLIVGTSWESYLALPERLPELIPSFSLEVWWGVGLGSFLAFYAFVGFEDMVNVAEEVKEPERNVPRAIILALIGSSILYLLIITAAVLALPIPVLSESDAPLALMFESATGNRPTLIALISLFAVLNGALIQMIMASRMLYGMGRSGWIPRVFAQVSQRTRTPLVATILITVGVAVFALCLPLVVLAKLTSFAVLAVFVLVNLSLIVIKRKNPDPGQIRVYPLWVPYGGLLLALSMLVFAIAGVLGYSA